MAAILSLIETLEEEAQPPSALHKSEFWDQAFPAVLCVSLRPLRRSDFLNAEKAETPRGPLRKPIRIATFCGERPAIFCSTLTPARPVRRFIAPDIPYCKETHRVREIIDFPPAACCRQLRRSGPTENAGQDTPEGRRCGARFHASRNWRKKLQAQRFQR